MNRIIKVIAIISGPSSIAYLLYMDKIPWALLSMLLFSTLLCFAKTHNKNRTRRIDSKLVKEILVKGGYVLIGEDAGGNLMFEKVGHPHEPSYEGVSFPETQTCHK